MGFFSVNGPRPVPPAAAFPADVTLQAIDGGPTYYADHGFTNAVNGGWDNPSFIPIGLFLEKYRNQTDANVWLDLNCNTSWSVQGDGLFSVMRTNGHSLVVQADEWNAHASIYTGNGGVLGTETVGVGTDEPGSYAAAIAMMQNTLNTHQDNRFFYENFMHTHVTFGDVGGVAMNDLLNDLIATPNATTRHLDLVSIDVYFFAGAFSSTVMSWADGIYNMGRNLTADEMRRGCRYGDLIAAIRGNGSNGVPAWQPTYPAPLGVFIETGTPYNDNTTESTAIRPAQINAAVWSTIINGARNIYYFTLGDASAWDNGGMIAGTFWQTPYNGESISNYAQVKATNALVLSLATVINSPTALGYVTVSPPPVKLTASVADSGFDVMAKYHNVAGGDNKFYIFAMPRTNATNQTATFTIKNTGASQVTVINESRTIPITGGGTTFQDTFATGNTVHIYRVD